MTINELRRLTEDEARELFESVMWPQGPTCPFCGNCSPKRITKITPNPAKRIRDGLYMCKDCKPRRQFTVTTSTVFHGSKFSLVKWLEIITSMTSAKFGTSTHQLRRESNEARTLNDGSIGYGNIECLWHAGMRVREAMREEPVANSLKGVLHADEVWVGGSPRVARSKREHRTEKQPVAILVEHGGTKAHIRAVCDVTKDTLFKHIRTVADSSSTIMTDENTAYKGIGEYFDGGHHSVCHVKGQYGKKEDGLMVSNNTAEAVAGIIQRSLYGVHIHVSRPHLQRYLDERQFVFGNRDKSDVEKVMLVLKGAVGKRLTYRRPKQAEQVAGLPE